MSTFLKLLSPRRTKILSNGPISFQNNQLKMKSWYWLWIQSKIDHCKFLVIVDFDGPNYWKVIYQTGRSKRHVNWTAHKSERFRNWKVDGLRRQKQNGSLWFDRQISFISVHYRVQPSNSIQMTDFAQDRPVWRPSSLTTVTFDDRPVWQSTLDLYIFK